MELTIKLDPETINTLIDGITKAVKNNPEDNKLYKLIEISKIFNIPYSTLKAKKLPCYQLSKDGKKKYSLNDVKEYLKVEGKIF